MEGKKELTEQQGFTKKTWVRLAAVILLICVAAGAFAYGIAMLISANDGYQEIECTASVANCSSEFIFTYNLGVSGMSPTAEKKAVTNLYNEKAAYYYRLFHPSETFDDVVNVAAINISANKTISVPSELYSALEKAVSDECRSIYLGPVYAYYDTLFSSSYDEDASTWDPARNAEMRAEFDKTVAFASNDGDIRLELKGNGKVTLVVSKEYLAFADEVGITSFIDFYWMKNAFIADFLAKDMTDAGYKYGVISSRDGFIRNFDASDLEYVYDVFDEKNGDAVAMGKLIYRGVAAVCSLHTFALDDVDKTYSYEYADGTRVTRYISIEDALPHGQRGNVVTFSVTRGCADMLIDLLPYYLSENVAEFASDGVGALYSDGGSISEKPLEGFTYYKN
ncbi:MAG: PspC domain-containing protein [Clostridia bacterium]|nr:PspC domain-containing protein [Clostridia bacterium]